MPATSNTIGVLIADSNQTQRQLLVTALRRRPEFHINYCGLEAESIFAAMSSTPTDVIVLNVGQPSDGLENMTIVRRLT